MFVRHSGSVTAAVLAGVIVVTGTLAWALDDGLALTPPMGWNSWNKFGCDINEELVRQVADAMVASGMKDAGYEYIVIDDCWQIERAEDGTIIADPERFPSGIGALADYVHSKGLKFGLYSDAGTATCQGRPGSRGYEFQDARTYASWGVDYLKYDWCSTSTQDARASYRLMRDALKKTGRPIVFSLCEWGTSEPWEWAADTGHLWRTTGDILDCWDCTARWGGMGFIRILDRQVGLSQYAGPGHWNDPDMLQVGNGGMSDTEYRTHFSLWCLLAAPLMAGNDLRDMSPETLEILTNREVIAVDQDPLGIQGEKMRDDGDIEIWAKHLQGGDMAVILLNRSDEPADITLQTTDLLRGPDSRFAARDLWAHEDLGNFTGSFTADNVPSHGVIMLRLDFAN